MTLRWSSEIEAAVAGFFLFTFLGRRKHGSPRLAKRPIDDNEELTIAAIHPDFCAAEPLSLMEFAGRVLISLTSFSLPV